MFGPSNDKIDTGGLASFAYETDALTQAALDERVLNGVGVSEIVKQIYEKTGTIPGKSRKHIVMFIGKIAAARLADLDGLTEGVQGAIYQVTDGCEGRFSRI